MNHEPWRWEQTEIKIQEDENQCIKDEKERNCKTKTYKIQKNMRGDDDSVGLPQVEEDIVNIAT